MIGFFNKKNMLRGGGILFIGLISALICFLSTDDYTNAKFRTMQDKIVSSEKVDLTGLRELSASGGPVVDFRVLKKQLGDIKKEIIIIDGISERHGYINNKPTTFFGYHRRTPDLRYLIRRLFFTGTLKVLPKQIVPESIMAKRYGFGFKNLRINSRLLTPHLFVDEFISYFDTAPKNLWFHFHCRHGKGRTSMALVMFDIIKNAPHVALEDIVKRQHLLGSVDLFDVTEWKANGTYSSKTLEERKKFIKDFYTFICQRKRGGIQLWADWSLQQQQGELTSSLPDKLPTEGYRNKPEG